MRHLLKEKSGQMAMVGAAIGLLVTCLIAVIVFYNIQASTVNTFPNGNTTLYGAYRSGLYNASHNASGQIGSQAATFFTIAPIVSVVIVAVVVIGYVARIGG